MNGFDAVILPMSVMLGQICGQGSKKFCDAICPTSKPTSYQMTSIEPTNSMLIHAIIF
jgi:hypothetical protein